MAAAGQTRMRAARAQHTPLERPSPVEDPSWPMRCICSLCECGGHRCSNFGPEEARRLAGGEPADEALLHCCNYAAAHERILNGDLLCAGQRAPTRSSRAPSDSPASDGPARANGVRDKRHAHHEDEQECGPAGQDGEPQSGPKGRPKRSRPVDEHRRGLEGEPGERHEWHGHETADEMLHVLVARPELARPRDNIVFEGQMDLKTTFETSYEALARMRLDHWRRYQEERGLQAAGGRRQAPSDEAEPSGGRPGRKGSRRVEENVSVEMGKQLGRGAGGGLVCRRQLSGQRGPIDVDIGPAPHTVASPQAVQPTEGHAPPASRHADGSPSSPALARGHQDGRKCVERGQAGGQEVSRTQSPLLGCQSDEHDHYGHRVVRRAAHHQEQSAAASPLERPHDRRQPRPPEGPPWATSELGGEDAELAEGSRGAPLAAQRGLSERRAQQQQQQRTWSLAADHVDPDLAPIIIYDANMNRLERVGLRKRSKYRPSTSLRTGARGLFGDQGGETGERPAAHTRSTRSTGNGGAKEAATSRGAHGKQAPTKEASQVSGLYGQAMTEEQMSEGRSRLLEGRAGLKSPGPFDYHEGKRRLPQNVNMTDHIKRHHLVESPFEGELPELDAAGKLDRPTGTDRVRPAQPIARSRRQAATAAPETGHSLEEPSLEPVQVDGRAPAGLDDEEEAAAVAEIQRCTLNDPHELKENQADRTPLHGASPQPEGAGPNLSRSSGTNSELQRHARMQRMCQNQSFYLFENEYPKAIGVIEEESFKIGTGRGSANEQAKQAATNSPNVLRIDRRKNLFRESPEFILTTGAMSSEFQQQQSTLKHQNHLRDRMLNGSSSSPVGDKEIETSRMTSSTPNQDATLNYTRSFKQEDAHHGHYSNLQDLPQQAPSVSQITEDDANQTIDVDKTTDPSSNVDMLNLPEKRKQPPDSSGAWRKCRVLDLEQDYEFVGLRSGHKYFVEKQFNATPLEESIAD